MTDGNYVLCETKGRVDKDVPFKARAAAAWCEAASQGGIKWQYLYVPEDTFESVSDNHLEMVLRTCAPTLKDLLRETVDAQLVLPFGEVGTAESEVNAFISADDFNLLPPRYQKAIEQAVTLFRFLEKKTDVSYAPVFTSLLGPLDEAVRVVLLRFLGDDVPDDPMAQRDFFEPDLSSLPSNEVDVHRRYGNNLRRTLVDQTGLMPIGLLRWCLNYARHSRRNVDGVFQSVKTRLAEAAKMDLYEVVDRIYSVRNEYIAHQEQELSDAALARQVLHEWVGGLYRIWRVHHQ
jgi:type III restriction enzyme